LHIHLQNGVLDELQADKRYLFYNLGNENLRMLDSGSAQSQITIADLKRYKITLPPIQEQKAIAKILSTLDQKIEVNNQINKTLENVAQAIFKQWFVDFEFPNEDRESYKSSGGEMVESELGMIPKGWEVKGLDEIAEFLNGLAMQKFRPAETEKAYPVLKIKELRQGRTDESSDLCSCNIDDKYIVRDGDIIFSWSGSLLVDIWCGGTCGLNQHLFKVTSDKFDEWFIYQWNKYHLDKFDRIAKSKATTMGHIKRKDLSDSKVLVPSSEIYLKAAQHQKYLFEKIKFLKVEMKRLEKIRDSLLPKLMSGEIRVPLDEEGAES
jgi:type I restriction enzyme S subunit